MEWKKMPVVRNFSVYIYNSLVYINREISQIQNAIYNIHIKFFAHVHFL